MPFLLTAHPRHAIMLPINGKRRCAMAWSDLYSPSFELTHWTYDDGSVAVELIQENGGKQKTRTKNIRSWRVWMLTTNTLKILASREV